MFWVDISIQSKVQKYFFVKYVKEWQWISIFSYSNKAYISLKGQPDLAFIFMFIKTWKEIPTGILQR